MLAINCKRQTFTPFFIQDEDISSVHGYIIPYVTLKTYFILLRLFEVTKILTFNI